MNFKHPRPDDYRNRINDFRKVKPVSYVNKTSALSPVIRRNDVTSGLEPYTGIWDASSASHLLKRTTFSVLSEDLSTFLNLGRESAVDFILSASEKPSPPLNDYNDFREQGYTDPTIPFGETWIHAIYDGEAEPYRISSLKSWLLKNMINQETNIHEKMLLFFHNILVTQTWEVFASKTSFQYFDLLRENCFGNYKSLIKSITKDPAMLLYLNGAFNIKDAPDENYGRELQELFCIGKGPDSNYTESDVQAAAKVLTGWTLRSSDFENEVPVEAVFHPPFHDTSDKKFSAFYNNKVISGRTGESGAEELDELIEMIFDNSETAKYFCRRLYTFFVYHEINETVETKIITPLADIFRDSNYEIMPVLRALFNSAHFFDNNQFGAMISSPAEHQVNLYRFLRYPEPSTDIQKDLYVHLTIHWYMSAMGMEIGDPPSVAGWPAYYQAPQFDKSWINSDSILKRSEISDILSSWGLYLSSDSYLPVNVIMATKQLQKPDDPNLLLEELSSLLFGIKLSVDVRDQLKLILLSGQESDYYWTNAWFDHLENEGNPEYQLIVENRLKELYKALFQYAEYHLI